MLEPGTRVTRRTEQRAARSLKDYPYEIGYVLCQARLGDFNIIWWPTRKFGEGRYTAEENHMLSESIDLSCNFDQKEW